MRQGLEEVIQTTRMHICIAHGHRQQCGKGRGGGLGGGVKWKENEKHL